MRRLMVRRLIVALMLAQAWQLTAAELRLVVELDDGSRLLGRTTLTQLPVQSAVLGKLAISLDGISEFRFSADHEFLTVSLINGDKLQGSLGEMSLPLKTIFGEVIVPLEHVTTVSVSRAGPKPAGLVLAYDFASVANQAVRDTVAGDHPGRLQQVAVELDAERGRAARFEGEGSYVSFPDTGLPAGNAARTVALWVKTQETSLRQLPFLYGQQRPGDAIYLVIYENRRAVTLGNWGGSGEVTGQSPVADGRWHHLALVYDGEGTALVYVDGALDMKTNRTYTTTTSNTGYLSVNVPNHGLRGWLDDFAVFDRALSAEEIAALYQSQRS